MPGRLLLARPSPSSFVTGPAVAALFRASRATERKTPPPRFFVVTQGAGHPPNVKILPPSEKAECGISASLSAGGERNNGSL